MNVRQQNRLRKEITDYLTDENIYKETDETVIDRLIMQWELAEYYEAKIAVDPEDWTAIVRVGMANKQIKVLMTMLGIDAPARLKLKKGEEPVSGEDELDEAMSNEE